MEKALIVTLFALIISVISLFLAVYLKNENVQNFFELISKIPSLSTSDYLKVEKVEVSYSPPSIALYADCYRLVGYVEDVQVRSIDNALHGIRDWRPNTHDVTSDIFNEFGIKLIDVRIENVTNNAYIAKAIIMQGNKIREVDIRPSDGIALALRLSSPIYIRKSLLESSAEKIC